MMGFNFYQNKPFKTNTDDNNTMSNNKLLLLAPEQFIHFLKSSNIKRFYFVFDSKTQKLNASHPELQQLANEIATGNNDFMQHEGMFFQLSSQYDILFGAFIHQTNRGQASGGLRYWQYENMYDFFHDGMRLAKGMTRKNALANLWWGGGKGIMLHNLKFDKTDKQLRTRIYQEFGSFISSINGCYITAEDVGTNEQDMANIFSQTRFTTCIPAAYGGSGNPSAATALGVVLGMEAALNHLKMGSLAGKTIAIQGMGHVAEPMIGYLFERKVAKVIAADINAKLIEQVKQKYSNENLQTQLVDIKDNSILFETCDILAPCATGAILNSYTIPKLNAKIVCGAANNQLKNSTIDGEILYNRGITYVPDFLVNRMGIVNCANEQVGYVDNDPMFERHLNKEYQYGVYQTSLKVLQQSDKNKRPPADVAIELADDLAKENHPIYGHRGKKIIQSLVDNKWHQ